MAFGDTITITLDSTPYVLTKINQDNYSSEYFYRDAVFELRLRIRHSKSVRSSVVYERHNAELTRITYAAGEEPEYSEKTYIVVESRPQDMETELTEGLADWLAASTYTALGKLVGWES
jgi:hypothetical protein